MDMTLVLTSLAQILLNPECRTIMGYVVRDACVHLIIYAILTNSETEILLIIILSALCIMSA